jgi:hypothetical protein
MSDASSKTTTNHEEIKKWAEERNATPSVVKGTEDDGQGEGVLRFNFPGYWGDNLEEISWDEFFKTFDEKHLAFLYQDKKADGEESNFCKFVSA